MQIHRKDNTVFIHVEAYRHEHLVSRMLVLAVILSFIAYGYFIGFTILNVIAQKEAVAKAGSIKSELGSLEQEYLRLTKDMTPEMGAHLGLTSNASREFVRRPGPVGLIDHVQTQ